MFEYLVAETREFGGEAGMDVFAFQDGGVAFDPLGLGAAEGFDFVARRAEVGPPGVGKTRTIMAARGLLGELAEFHIAPTSVLMASLVDCLLEAKRTIINVPNPPIEFNSMLLCVDEFSAFMHQYDTELVGGLTTFYDCVPYSQHRRGKDIRIKIKRPQLSIMAGTTPSNLIQFMPEGAWEQGLTSRILLIYSEDRPALENIFIRRNLEKPKELVHDLRIINSLVGEFSVDEQCQDAINNWRKLNQPPVPKHPKLLHYNTRRLAHLLKLCMVSSCDSSDSLHITVSDFNRAMGWLLEAELYMPEIFRSGAQAADGKAMDEILHFMQINDIASKGLPEHKLVNFIRERVPAHAVMRVLEIMEKSNMIKAIKLDKSTGTRQWIAVERAGT